MTNRWNRDAEKLGPSEIKTMLKNVYKREETSEEDLFEKVYE